MARFRGASIMFALLAAIIGIIALFGSPAFSITWWSVDEYDSDWCEDCQNAGRMWYCQWICGGPNNGQYYCDVQSNFQGGCWTGCWVPCGDK